MDSFNWESLAIVAVAIIGAVPGVIAIVANRRQRAQNVESSHVQDAARLVTVSAELLQQIRDENQSLRASVSFWRERAERAVLVLFELKLAVVARHPDFDVSPYNVDAGS